MIVLASIVSFEYLLIAVFIVPRLAALADGPGSLIHAATWGAAAFFLGCSVTHLALVVQSIRDPMMMMSDQAMFLWHVVPHLAQVIGGALFIGIAARRLDIRLAAKEVAARLQEVEQRFRASFERAPIGMALVSLRPGSEGLLLQVNPALCAMVGGVPGQLQGRTVASLTYPGDDALLPELATELPANESDAVVEKRYQHVDGREVWVAVQSSIVHDFGGGPLYNVAQIRDVTEQRLYEHRLQFLADHDGMTGLFNRRRFEDELQRAVAVVRRQKEPAALVIVDLDHFKYVNDTYGHAIGDEILRRAGQVLTARTRATDVVGRLGGDEFGVILPDTDVTGAQVLAAELAKAMRIDTEVVVEARRVRITVSVGVMAIEPATSLHADALLVAADAAMYDAKDAGRDRVALATLDTSAPSPSLMRSRLSWSERVRDAIENDGFELWEQPIAPLQGSGSARSELLLRMTSTEVGQPHLPGLFLDIAERFGQVQAIDRWVIGHAVRLLSQRQTRGDHRVLEVNLSGSSITDAALIDDIVATIAAAPFDPSSLVIEVTETAAISNIALARRFADRVADLGCQFALDDFGSGFGSFYYLKHLPFDCIKIDGEFIRDLPRAHADQLTVQAIVQIAGGLGKTTIAEYVQDEETMALLRDYGIDYAQGYHLGRPTPVAETRSV